MARAGSRKHPLLAACTVALLQLQLPLLAAAQGQIAVTNLPPLGSTAAFTGQLTGVPERSYKASAGCEAVMVASGNGGGCHASVTSAP